MKGVETMKHINPAAIQLAIRYAETHSDMYAFAYNGSDSMHVIVYKRESVISALEAGRVAALEENRGSVRVNGKSYISFRHTFGTPVMDIATSVASIADVVPVEGYRGDCAKAAAFEKIAVKAIGERFSNAKAMQVGNLHNSKVDGIITAAAGRLTIEVKFFHGTLA